MRKGTKMTKKSRKLISLGMTGEKNPNFGKHHSNKTKKIIRDRALEQFKNGMPKTTIVKMKKSHQKRVFLSIGNTFVNSRGYRWLKTGNKKYEAEHRYKVEKYIGRKLKRTELIHHLDGNTTNNKLSNLYLFTNKALHFSFEILVKNQWLKRDFIKSNLKEFKVDLAEKGK